MIVHGRRKELPLTKSEVFDQNTIRYDGWFEKYPQAFQSELLAVKNLLPAAGEGLEIGVGSGRFAASLGIKTGVEPSLNMAALAIERGVTVLQGTAENLPVSDQSYAYGLMVTTICFVDDVKRALSEVRRVVKKDGAIVIGFVEKNSFLGKKYQKNARRSIFYRQAVFFSAEEMQSSLQSAGFSDFTWCQTLYKYPKDIRAPEPVKEGYGEGAFVVVRAQVN